jgi:acyl carrier protein
MSAADADAVKATIRSFIQRSIAVPGLDDDADLFESGIVNSLFAVQLMTFIERTFAIEMGMDDLEIYNFKSLNSTTGFVMRRSRVAAE